MIIEENRREIKAYSTTFLCSRSSWRRDYLEHIKIIMDQASLSLGLTHNEINSGLHNLKYIYIRNKISKIFTLITHAL
ncbi:unnamed protein product [Spirodela intermedia]|uniref:Uncharacterized protein n=1 Tax=Spirodela intermedia TaxID=51605 RepID=A0A7I8KLF1_SPIIN|nr:unnamed protein product [Spirodela intermedia]